MLEDSMSSLGATSCSVWYSPGPQRRRLERGGWYDSRAHNWQCDNPRPRNPETVQYAITLLSTPTGWSAGNHRIGQVGGVEVARRGARTLFVGVVLGVGNFVRG
jgi:hypothetical protein